MHALVLMTAFWERPVVSPPCAGRSACLPSSVSSAGGITGARQFQNPRPAPSRHTQSDLQRAGAGPVLGGDAPVFLPGVEFRDAASHSLLCAGMLCGGAFSLASIPLAAVAFTTPIVAASALSLLRVGGADYVPSSRF